MTKPREWPNNMKHHRDRAAEEVNTAVSVAERLLSRVERGEFTRSGLERDLLKILRHGITAVRHLEKAGAETTPK